MPRVMTGDQTDLSVGDWGSGQPVILIHGWPLSSDTWDDQAMAFAQAGCRAIAYDRRGGEVARYMSRHHGKSVAKAVLVSASLPYRLKTSDNPLGAEQAAFDKTAQALNDDRPRFLARFFVVTADEEAVRDELLAWARSVSMQARLRATLGCAKSFTTTDFRPERAAFKVPTPVIHGVDDKSVPIEPSSRLTAKGIAQSTLVENAGAPHGLFATHKEWRTKDLLDFLAH